MAKPRVNNFPLPQNVKIPVNQAIGQVGQASGLNPQQAGIAAAMTQAGLSHKQTIIINQPKVRQ